MSRMITIGKISKIHGRKRELKCLVLTDFPERFFDLERVFLEKDDDIRLVHVDGVRFHKNSAILSFEEVHNLNEAEELKGYYLKIPENEAILLPEGHFFMHEIMGIDVYTDEGEHLGQIEDILTTGSNDVYVVGRGSDEILIPSIQDVVKEIDLDEKKMTIHIIEGLLD